MTNINIDQLADTINTILLDYCQSVQEAVDEEAKEVAKACTKKLKAESPKRTGAYSKSWRFKKDKYGNWVVYNKDHYRLTHLLEFGHRMPKNGRVDGIPHIKNVERWAIKDFEQRVQEAISRASK